MRSKRTLIFKKITKKALEETVETIMITNALEGTTMITTALEETIRIMNALKNSERKVNASTALKRDTGPLTAKRSLKGNELILEKGPEMINMFPESQDHAHNQRKNDIF